MTLYGEGRGFRVAWLLEEMGLPYRLRPVDLLAGIEDDREFLTLNPSGFIPVLRDGDSVIIESIAIMEYLLARHGPTPLAPAPQDAAFPLYQQFLHLGEAGLMMPLYFHFLGQRCAPVPNQDWGTREAMAMFHSRRDLVTRRLHQSPWLAGDSFTAADISVAYALRFASQNYSVDLDPVERDYMTRVRARPAYIRALDICQASRANE